MLPASCQSYNLQPNKRWYRKEGEEQCRTKEMGITNYVKPNQYIFAFILCFHSEMQDCLCIWVAGLKEYHMRKLLSICSGRDGRVHKLTVKSKVPLYQTLLNLQLRTALNIFFKRQ